MAISTPVLKASGFDTAPASATLTTGSITFTAGRLYRFIYTLDRSGSVPDLSTGFTFTHGATDRSADWTLYKQQTYGTPRVLGAYYYVAAVTETVTLSFSPGGSTPGSHAYRVEEVASGFNAAAPIAQSASASATSTGSVSATLASAPTTGNLLTADVATRSASGALDPRTNWTELDEVLGTGTTTDSGAFEGQYTFTLEQTGSGQPHVAGNRTWGIIVTEIAAASAGSTGSGSPTVALGASGAGTATQTFSGSGTPSKTLGTSVSGTASQKFSGSGSPTKTLGTSASGTATNTYDPVAGTSSGARTSNATSHTINLPDGSNVAGRRLVMFFNVDDQQAVTWPSGWTEVGFVDGNAGNNRMYLVYRDLDGTEGYAATGATATATVVTSDGSSHVVFLLDIGTFESATPPEFATTAPTGTSTTADPPSLTPPGGSKQYLWLAAAGADGSVTMSGTPTGYGHITTAAGAYSGGTAIIAGSKVATASSEDPGAYTISAAEQRTGMTVAIYPAAVPATGSGSPTATLSASGAGTASQKFVGTGSPSKTLGTSASGTAVQKFNGSGSPTKTLGTSASGTATNTAPPAGSAVGSGSPTATLVATGAGDATMSQDIFTGSGAATTSLTGTGAGTASEKFSGSGSPTKALSASGSGVAANKGYDGPLFSDLPVVFGASTGSRQIAWPADYEVGQTAVLLIETQNQAPAAPTAVAGGTPSNFTFLGSRGIGTGDSSSCRIDVYTCRATALDMSDVLVADPGDHVSVAMLIFDNVRETGGVYDVKSSGSTTSPASTSITLDDGPTTTVKNGLAVGVLASSYDPPTATASIMDANAWSWPNVHNVEQIFDQSHSSSSGGGITVVVGQVLPAGTDIGLLTGTSTQSTRTAGFIFVLAPPDPRTATGSPTKTLTATGAGTASSNANLTHASGAPTATLTAAGAGTATEQFNASGDATTTLTASGDGTATSVGVNGRMASGAPVVTLVVVCEGLAFSTRPRQAEEPPPQAFGGGRPRRIYIPDEEPEPELPRKKRRKRRPRPAAPAPEAAPLPELPPAQPAFQPFALDPLTWATMLMPSQRPVDNTPTRAELAEEEAFLAHLLEVL